MGSSKDTTSGQSRPVESTRTSRAVLLGSDAEVRSDPEALSSLMLARMSLLAHELSNLLDGSMRCVSLAARRVDAALSADGAAGPDNRDDILRRLTTVYAALEQMTGLLRSTMAAVGRPGRSGIAGRLSAGYTIQTAVMHAADVMRPIAAASGVSIRVAIDRTAGELPAGPIYPLMTAALRNAVEAILRRADVGPPGEIVVHVSCPLAGATNDGTVAIEVSDNGIGPPPLPSGEADRIFEFGFSTKPGCESEAGAGTGLGLALAREIAAELGGELKLLPNHPAGATLRLLYRPAAVADSRPCRGSSNSPDSACQPRQCAAEPDSEKRKSG